MMTRRNLALRVALLLGCTTFQGCDLFHNQIRSKTSDAEPEEEESTSSKAAPVESQPTKGFFGATRLPGAMSSEGRDIERNLGIH